MLLSLAVLAGLVVAVIGAAAGVWPVGLALGLVVGRLVVWAAWRDLEGSVLAPLHARPLVGTTTAEARLDNLVDGLCLAAGVPRPAVLVVDDARPNAMAVGRDPRHATVVVTSGLLDALDRVELEAVVAHELSHVRAEDIRPATMAARVGRLPLVGPLCRGALLDQASEAHADVGGVAMTRYPPGLVAAFAKLTDPEPPGPAASRHLWLVSPTTDLQERVQALREL